MEPHAALADAKDGKTTVWPSTQSPFPRATVSPPRFGASGWQAAATPARMRQPAIFDATGARLLPVPMTPERVPQDLATLAAQ